jgi:hypothetical protein
MKDLGQTKFCLALQLEHLPTRILVHQSAYIQKVLEKFNMDKSYPSKTPMVVRSLEFKTDQFRPQRRRDSRTSLPISQCHWSANVSCKLQQA